MSKYELSDEMVARLADMIKLEVEVIDGNLKDMSEAEAAVEGKDLLEDRELCLAAWSAIAKPVGFLEILQQMTGDVESYALDQLTIQVSGCSTKLGCEEQIVKWCRINDLDPDGYVVSMAEDGWEWEVSIAE